MYAQIVGEVVEVNSNETFGLTVSFDKKPTQVSLDVAYCHLYSLSHTNVDLEERCTCS